MNGFQDVDCFFKRVVLPARQANSRAASVGSRLSVIIWEFILSRARYALTCLAAFPFVLHEINKHAVLQIHAEASKP